MQKEILKSAQKMKIILKKYPQVSEVAHEYGVCGFFWSLTVSRSVGTETGGFMFPVSPGLRVLAH